MQELSEQIKEEIINALEARGAKLPCPRCGNQSFAVLDGFFNQSLIKKLKGPGLLTTTIPSVVVVCKQCGYLSQHALGVLGLLHPEE